MDTQPDNQSAAMPTLCRGGCGFYGSSATEGFCSKCFKDVLKRKQDPNRQTAGSSLFPATSSSSSLTSANESDSNESGPRVSSTFIAKRTVETGADAAPAATSSSVAATTPAATTLPTIGGASASSTTLATACPSGAAATTSTTAANLDDNAAVVGTLGASASAPVLATQAEQRKVRTRCEKCNKKVGFTGFECRCGGMFCGIHRYSDMHGCTFDYKSFGAEEIKKNNPVIAKEKIEKL